MAKQKTKESQKEKEQEKANQKLSPSEVGLQQNPQIVQEAPAGERAPTVTTEEGTTVQVGQKDQSQQQPGTSEQERTMHPLLGVAFETNVIKYKGRSTEFLTLGKKLTDQPLYPFRGGSKKQRARITLTEDGKRLIIEKVQE